MLKDKFNLTKEQNIFLAKKTITENIYHTARLEGCNITFPDTITILDGVSVGNLSMDDVQVVLNLRDAWRYALKHIDAPFSLEFACKINEYVARNESLDWGVLRYGNVGISGTSYVPPIPAREEVVKAIAEFHHIQSVTERAIRYMLWAMRSQLFWDGNKRTSIICANKMLIKEGKGLIIIQEQVLREWNVLLTQFYETNNCEPIMQFVYDKCLFGLEIPK
jgi:hypothetical protein